MHHGRQDLLQVFKEEPTAGVTVQQQQPFSGTMMQTINNPDGSVSIIQIDPGPSQVVTLPDGTQATVVHAVSSLSKCRLGNDDQVVIFLVLTSVLSISIRQYTVILKICTLGFCLFHGNKHCPKYIVPAKLIQQRHWRQFCC